MAESTNLAVKKIRILILVVQCMLLLGIYVFARTPYLLIISTLSFIPPFLMCFENEDVYVLFSFILFFISQHSIILSAQPVWGYGFGSDSMNDLHIVSVLSEQSHFEFGLVGYGRTYYSFYPLLHIFSNILLKITSISLINIGKYVLPFLNATLTVSALYLLFNEMGLKDFHKNFSIVVFGASWYYTLFHANFLREVYAFPLCLMLLFTSIKILNDESKYLYLFYLFYISILYSHQFSTYLIIILTTVLSISYYVYKNKKNMFYPILIMILLLLINTTELFYLITIKYFGNTLQIFFKLFEEQTITILPGRPIWKIYSSYIYYVVIGVLTFFGYLNIRNNPNKFKNRQFVPVLIVTCMVFVISILLRIAGTGDWAYYMSRRGTIWAFLGISILVTFGVDYFNLHDYNNKIRPLMLLFIIIILSIGKFNQYPPVISDKSIIARVTYTRYKSVDWLKEYAKDGSAFLTPPKEYDSERSIATLMAPYGYLRNYYLDIERYDDFSGYIPFIGDYYDRFLNETDVSIMYSNGDVSIGYK